MTHFSWAVDGSIVGLYLLVTMIAGLMVRRYVSKVDDFLLAGREMNVYLGIASLAATEFGIVSCMYAAQNGYDKGSQVPCRASSTRRRCSSLDGPVSASNRCATPARSPFPSCSRSVSVPASAGSQAWSSCWAAY